MPRAELYVTYFSYTAKENENNKEQTYVTCQCLDETTFCKIELYYRYCIKTPFKGMT